MAAQSSWKNTGMLAGVTDCRRSQNWDCKGRWALGFKPRPGSHRRRDHVALKRRRRPRGSKVNGEKDHAVLKEGKEDHEVLECFFLPRGLGSRRDFAAIEKGREDSCWWAMRRCRMALD